MPGEKNKKNDSDSKSKKEVSIIVLNDPKGASGYGHLAIMVKNSKGVWEFVSKEGRQKNHWYSPEGKLGELIGGPALPPLIQYFNSWKDFRNAQLGNSPYAKNLAGYTEAIGLFADEKQDSLALNAAENSARSYYHVLYSNCADAVSNGLSAAGFDPGYQLAPGGANADAEVLDPEPNIRINEIIWKNAGSIDTSFHPFEKPAVSKDMKDIQNKIDALQQEKNSYMNEMASLSVSPFDLTTEQQQKLQADTKTTNELQARIDDLKHIQQELQTGDAINKPFNIPDMPNWKMKGDTNHIQPLGPLMGPPFNNPNTNDGQLSWPNSIRYLVNPDDNAGNSFIGNPLNNQASANIKPSATTHSISPAQVAPSASAKNKGVGGNISFNMHTNDTIASPAKVLRSVHDEVVAILTSAVADSKIGTDIH